MRIFRNGDHELKWWVTVGGVAMLACFWSPIPATVFVVLVILRTVVAYWRPE